MLYLNLHDDISSYVAELPKYSKLNNVINLIKNEGCIKFENKSNETIVVIKTTRANEEVVFQFWDNTSSSIISWGDGNVDVLGPHVYDEINGHDDDYPRHTYSEPGEYTVILKGDNITSNWFTIDDEGKWYADLGGKYIDWSNSADYAFPDQIIKAIQLGKHIKSCIDIFTGKSELVEISEDLFKYCKATQIDYCFSSSGLSEIPANLFKYSAHVKTLSRCFYRCTNLTHIPANLFSPCKNATDFRYCFNICSSIENIGNGIFDGCVKAKYFNYAFADCKKITSLPEDLFKNCKNAINFGDAFSKCIGLQTLNVNIFNDCVNVKDFTKCFNYCTALQSIEKNIFETCVNAEKFNYCFYNCASLENIVENLFINTKKVTSFDGCFYSCSSINHEYNLTPEGQPKLWERAGLPGYPTEISGSSFASGTSSVFRSSINSSWR